MEGEGGKEDLKHAASVCLTLFTVEPPSRDAQSCTTHNLDETAGQVRRCWVVVLVLQCVL